MNCTESAHREHGTDISCCYYFIWFRCPIVDLTVLVIGSLPLKRIFRIGIVQKNLSYVVRGSTTCFKIKTNFFLVCRTLKVPNNYSWLGPSIVLSLTYS